MEDWKKDRIGSAVKGENPTVIAKMKSGFVVIGDTQFSLDTAFCLVIQK